MTDKLVKDMYNQLYNLDRSERMSKTKTRVFVKESKAKARANSKRSRAHRLDQELVVQPQPRSPEEQMLREREQANAIAAMCKLYTNQMVNTENFLRVVGDILEGK